MVATKPNPMRNSRGFWDEDSVKFMKTLEGEVVTAEIYSVVSQEDSPLLNVTLKLADSTIVNDYLKSTEAFEVPLAVDAVESYLSEENHQHRINHSNYPPSWKRHLDAEQAQQMSRNFCEE